MKKIFVFLSFAFCAFSVSAQDNAFQTGTGMLRASVGVLPTFGSSFSGGGYSSKWTPPLSISYEYGISDRVSIGLMGGYATQKIVDQSDNGFKYNHLLIGARGSYHFATTESFDPYFGVLLGYNKVSVSDVGSSSSSGSFGSVSASGVLPGGYLGMNYYFTPGFGVHAEIGYGIAVATAGITFSF